jgi:DNA-binding MarR family transcriptional regulator
MISPEQVGERYLTVHRRMHRAVDTGMLDCGLTLARTKVLMQLGTGPVRPSVLATGLDLAPHTITDIVDALERDGLVARQPDPTDRRAKLVALTSEGEVALAAASRTRERLIQHVFGALDAADRVAMMRLLGVLDGAVAALAALPCADPAVPEPVDPLAVTDPAVPQPVVALPDTDPAVPRPVVPLPVTEPAEI